MKDFLSKVGGAIDTAVGTFAIGVPGYLYERLSHAKIVGYPLRVLDSTAEYISFNWDSGRQQARVGVALRRVNGLIGAANQNGIMLSDDTIIKACLDVGLTRYQADAVLQTLNKQQLVAQRI